MTEQRIDLLVSSNQIGVRAVPWREADHRWGVQNLAQGCVLHDSVFIADPLVEGAFGANVFVRVCDAFAPDALAQRSLMVGFDVVDALVVESAAETIAVTLEVPRGPCTLHFEVCLGDEVFYVFTFVMQPSPTSIARCDDGWGLVAGQLLQRGFC